MGLLPRCLTVFIIPHFSNSSNAFGKAQFGIGRNEFIPFRVTIKSLDFFTPFKCQIYTATLYVCPTELEGNFTIHSEGILDIKDPFIFSLEFINIIPTFFIPFNIIIKY